MKMRIRHAVAAVVIPVVMSVAATPSFAGVFESIEHAVAKDATKAAEKRAVKEVGQAGKVIVVVVPEGANLTSAVRTAVSKARSPEGEVARMPGVDVARIPGAKEFKPLATEAGQFTKRQVNDPRMSLRNP
jgi:hypothetical protein